jgi:hypothetical protein
MKKDSLLNFLSLAWIYLIMFQVLRLDYGKLYLPILLTFALLNILLIIRSGYIFLPVSYVSLNLWIFYILMIFISAMTFFYGDLKDFLKAFPRMLLMPLTAFFLFNFIKKKNQFYRILNIYLFFGVLGSLSLVYQVFFGTLDFLTIAGNRENLVRYSTSFGSLTSYGATVGILMLVLVLLEPKKSVLKIFFGIFLFSLCGIITLSKAGLANVLIFALIFIIFIRIKYKLFYILISFLALYLTYFYVPEINDYIKAAINSLKLGSEAAVGGIEEQAFTRFVGGIIRLSHHSIYANFFGFGLLGGQGAFGLPLSISGTTHNQYTELFNIGGIFLFINVLALLISLMIKLLELMRKDDLARLFFYCNSLGMFNMFFFNGFLYQPYSSFVLWLSIVYVLFRERINLNEKNI